MRTQNYYDEIRERKHVMDDELSAEQRQRQSELQKEYRKAFTQQRPRYDAAYAPTNEPRPTRFDEALKLADVGNKKRTISLGKGLYQRVTGTSISREAVSAFIASCPPFRAFIYATMSDFDLALRDKHRGEGFEAGRNDMYMAVYPPYCDEFVTDEKHGEQEKCLRKIAAAAGLHTDVLSYDDFRKRLAEGD